LIWLAFWILRGGGYPAVRRLYRFRTVRVYLPTAFGAAKKALPRELFTQN
jgi:hypothetical protein